MCSHSVVSDSLQPHGLHGARQAPLSMEILQERILEWVAIPFPRDLPDAGIKPGCPALQADSLPPEPEGEKHANLFEFYMTQKTS